MTATRTELMNTELANKDFGRYQTVIPVSWGPHRSKDLGHCLYDRYIAEYETQSVSITYVRRKVAEHELDEVEDLMFVPKWAFEREKEAYRERVNEREADVNTVSVERVATRGDVGLLLTRVNAFGLYTLEFREWFRSLTPPLAQIILAIVTKDSEAEVQLWRDWFSEKIIAHTSVDWDPVSSLGPFGPE